VINKATPVITWANPADITYPAALGGTQLNATANVPGSFVYSPVSGTVLNAGDGQTLSVAFTPTDTTDYNTANANVTINVKKATPTVVVTGGTFTLDGNPHPATCTVTGAFGGSVSGACALTYTLGSSSPTTSAPVGVGTYAVTATFTSTDGNYGNATGTGTIKIQYAQGGMCYGDAGHQILQPINVDGTSVFKQKSTVPVKFRVCDANGNSVGTAGVVQSFALYQIYAGTVLQTVTEDIVSTNNDTAFRWDPTAQQWIFNLSTKNLSANMTFYYRINLNDGSFIQFQYGLK
jgi:hypothetical protein